MTRRSVPDRPLVHLAFAPITACGKKLAKCTVEVTQHYAQVTCGNCRRTNKFLQEVRTWR